MKALVVYLVLLSWFVLIGIPVIPAAIFSIGGAFIWIGLSS